MKPGCFSLPLVHRVKYNWRRKNIQSVSSAMTENPGLFDRVLGTAIDFIGGRWWLSLAAAAVSFAYPVYYFLNWSEENDSRSGFKLVIALILLGLAMLAMTYLSLTSP